MGDQEVMYERPMASSHNSEQGVILIGFCREKNFFFNPLGHLLILNN